MNRRTIILLAILGISLVIFIAVLIFTDLSFGRSGESDQQNLQIVKLNTTNDDNFVSDLFEKRKEKVTEEIQVSDDDVESYERDCVLWGDRLKEGTVNTDTVCVKERL
jgi:hypothetical protein